MLGPMRHPREREMRLKVDVPTVPLVMLPQVVPSRQAPADNWDGPYGCVKFATWYQEVLNWLILPAHYLLNWQDSGIFFCSCAAHTTCHTAGRHPALPFQHLNTPL